ncbi:hypothetical protein B0A58_14965 [Flavobacterium branchiophilum NBRC 15030 = ATCC 35035]|nr:hypothetical protein B0A58_14965 [Flavobacterium branchiophilum NBRC 15030 = ATCC 35035]
MTINVKSPILFNFFITIIWAFPQGAGLFAISFFVVGPGRKSPAQLQKKDAASIPNALIYC